MHKLKGFLLRLLATAGFLSCLLLLIILNPALSYAEKTDHNQYHIFSNSRLDRQFLARLDEATLLVGKSEFYDSTLALDVCLNDRSFYPAIIKTFMGPNFATGFYNKVVLNGQADYSGNSISLNGYRWNLSQLLAHEITHCLQFRRLGILHSNPLASIPSWKYEGYPEYIARRNNDQRDLRYNINRLMTAEKSEPGSWGINFSDATSVSREYYRDWLLIQYLIDIQKMTYRAILADSSSETSVKYKMMQWYNGQLK